MPCRHCRSHPFCSLLFFSCFSSSTISFNILTPTLHLSFHAHQMNRAAITTFSDEFSNAERLSTTPASLSQKIRACGGENASISYCVPDSIPLPSYQRGRSRARNHRESVKKGDGFSFTNTRLSSASKKRNRTRTVQSSRLSSLCDTENAYLLKSLIEDLTQHSDASIGTPFPLRRRESTALSDSPLTAESTHCLGKTHNPLAQERRPTNEPLGNNEKGQPPAPISYRQSGNSVVEVLPWLIEAIDTVNDLESRFQELERDCKVSYCVAIVEMSSWSQYF